MTDPTPPPSAPPPESLWSAPAPVRPASHSYALGVVAIGLACVALVVVILPYISGFVFLISVAAIIVAIVALARRAPIRGFAIAALIIAPIAWILSIFAFFAFLLGGGTG